MWFQEHLVPAVEQVRVVTVDLHDGALQVKLESGEQLQARAVVGATGLTGFAHLPHVLAAAVPEGPSPAGAVSHSSQHSDLQRFAGQEGSAVGAGQPAVES